MSKDLTPSVVKQGLMTATEYRVVHYWVERTLGRPTECENCGTTEAGSFHWANLSGRYKRDVADWARLCPRCHIFIDGNIANTHPPLTVGGSCRFGHRIAAATDLYYGPSNRSPECRACRRFSRLSYQRRRALEAREANS